MLTAHTLRAAAYQFGPDEPATRICEVCFTEFTPVNLSASRGIYCGRECYKIGQGGKQSKRHAEKYKLTGKLPKHQLELMHDPSGDYRKRGRFTVRDVVDTLRLSSAAFADGTLFRGARGTIYVVRYGKLKAKVMR